MTVDESDSCTAQDSNSDLLRGIAVFGVCLLERSENENHHSDPGHYTAAGVS